MSAVGYLYVCLGGVRVDGCVGGVCVRPSVLLFKCQLPYVQCCVCVLLLLLLLVLVLRL